MVAGTDEAGRGCLAGPLVVAAVCLDVSERCGRDLADLNDSKQLNEDVRERLFRAIVRRAAAFVVVVVSADEIDRRGLHRSNLDGMASALRALGDVPEVRLSDGFRLGQYAPSHTAVTGGDGRSAAIAAASVIAKVTRDQVHLSSCHPHVAADNAVAAKPQRPGSHRLGQAAVAVIREPHAEAVRSSSASSSSGLMYALAWKERRCRGVAPCSRTAAVCSGVM